MDIDHGTLLTHTRLVDALVPWLCRQWTATFCWLFMWPALSFPGYMITIEASKVGGCISSCIFIGLGLYLALDMHAQLNKSLGLVY